MPPVPVASPGTSDNEDFFKERGELEYWSTFPVGQSTRISPKGLPVKTVDTDASDSSYGWYWLNETVPDTFSMLWKEKHINVKELYALRQFLVRNQRDLEQCLLC